MEEELKRALNEQAFGIMKYETVSSSPMKATARVVLIENDAILVSLTSRGFQLHHPTESPMDPDSDAENVFETLEQLLINVSPKFEAAHRSALQAKLQSLGSPDGA
ncbi:hypothetical protein L226DRAFT_568570 [Lentinus tigrinus ALCF2SS1-7]|uniref:GSKIP domain-containing protein n=1 Tax=Lentinus tigrinus ALCF2SS1-6 TaxID=1328759 RepID=A0A5C2SHW9_9APHY|nr:hypothetical protein L227DRAFT_609287 [Lentinus tigrinus ALCF2SS1-6]RPD77507.1 hypothetical protein L226DRAFT_568570 [Lentinus tigrinus ALCF2SS1-7]